MFASCHKVCLIVSYVSFCYGQETKLVIKKNENFGWSLNTTCFWFCLVIPYLISDVSNFLLLLLLSWLVWLLGINGKKGKKHILRNDRVLIIIIHLLCGSLFLVVFFFFGDMRIMFWLYHLIMVCIRRNTWWITTIGDFPFQMENLQPWTMVSGENSCHLIHAIRSLTRCKFI